MDIRKIAAISAFIYLNSPAMSQVFYKSSNSDEIQNLKKNGITYIKTGTRIDSAVINALKIYWKCTAYTIKDPSSSLLDNETILSATNIITYQAAETILGIYPASERENGAIISKKNLIGYISLNGFNQALDTASLLFYMPFSISGLNAYLDKLIYQQFDGSFFILNSKVADAVSINACIVKSKILLIVDNTIGRVILPDLEKYKMNYQFISRTDIGKSLNKYETGEYYLLYYSKKQYLNIAIYDVKDKHLIFTILYDALGLKEKSFDKQDILKINKYCNE